MKRFTWKNRSLTGRTSDEAKVKCRDGGIVEQLNPNGVNTKNIQPESPSPGANSKPRSSYRPLIPLTPNRDGGANAELPRLPTPPIAQSFDFDGLIYGKPARSRKVYTLQEAPVNNMLFDAQLPPDYSVPVSPQENDGNETDYFSLNDDTESVSSSPTQSDTPKIIITPPSMFEQPHVELGHLGSLPESNVSTLSVSMIYSISSPPSFVHTEYFLDENFLMPPCPENLLDQRRYKRAREYREVKKWLIEFLNSKGHQFPTKLRCRVMEIYGIGHYDLAPETVAKFKDEPQDEVVSLNYVDSFEEVEGENSDAQLLRILRAFFKSQIQEVTPKIDHRDLLQGFTTDKKIQKKYPSMALSSPITKSRSVPNFQSYKTRKSAVSTPPLRSGLRQTSLTRPSTPKSHSLMPVEELPVHSFVPPGLGNVNLSSTEQETRANRNRIIAGTFGAVREAVGGRSRMKRRSTLI